MNKEDLEIEKAITKFSAHLMSNSKWLRLIDNIIKNDDIVKKMEFKKVHKDTIGQLYLHEDTTYQYDYWENGFEGCNSLGGWLTFKEIEYLLFPRVIDHHNNTQDLNEIMHQINSVGKFNLEIDENALKLICYK